MHNYRLVEMLPTQSENTSRVLHYCVCPFHHFQQNLLFYILFFSLFSLYASDVNALQIVTKSKGDSQIQVQQETNQTASGLQEPAKNGDKWSGTKTLIDTLSKKTIAQITITKQQDTYSGSYVLSSNFCQNDNSRANSRCPFKGASGTFNSVDGNTNFFTAIGQDPYWDTGTFVITMMSSDGNAIDMVSATADSLPEGFILELR